MRSVATLAAGVSLIFSALASAHHSYSMFDTTRVVQTAGSLKVVEWTNPHVWLWVDVAGENGTVTFGFESLSPAQLRRDYGCDRHMLKSGEHVRIDYSPLKSGQPGGALIKVTLQDGRTLLTRFSRPTDSESSGAGKKRGTP